MSRCKKGNEERVKDRSSTRKGLVFGTVFLLVAAIFVNAFPMSVYADDPTNVWVDDDSASSSPGWGVTHFDKIQDGVDAVDEGGTVYVYTGIYSENVVIGKSLTLEGEDADTTILQGTGSGYGIYSYGVSGITIKDLQTDGFSNGILLYNSGSSTVTGNTVTANNNPGI